MYACILNSFFHIELSLSALNYLSTTGPKYYIPSPAGEYKRYKVFKEDEMEMRLLMYVNILPGLRGGWKTTSSKKIVNGLSMWTPLAVRRIHVTVNLEHITAWRTFGINVIHGKSSNIS